MIEVLHYERINKNKIIGYVDVKFPKWNNMIIRKIAHLESEGKRWFNLPSFPRQKADGTLEYLRYWQFELDVHTAQLLEKLSDKVKEYCLKNKIQEIEPLNFENPLIS
jgi:hypothetical protein